MNIPKRIYIVGHPGAGKALLARELAEKLGWEFVDADIGIEYRIGKMITDILGVDGAKCFHECQFDILQSFNQLSNLVFATDVSVVCDKKNREFLDNEFVIYLKTSTETQLERTSRNPLPLLDSHPKALFDNLHQDRDVYFSALADITIDGDDSSLEKHLNDITQALFKHDAQCHDKIILTRKDMTLFHKTQGIPIYLPEHQAICLKLLSQGKSSKEIARILDISHRTVEGYIAKLTDESGCSSSKELIALYHDQA